jgi:hypothetical protein
MISLQVRLPSQSRPSQLLVLTAFSLALLALAAAWAQVDPRLLDGTPVWAKPIKFALSFAVMFGTLALIEQRLSPDWRNGWTLKITVAVMATAMITEMGYMIFMAAQQDASHFNFSTPFTTLMYSLMGVGAVSLIVGVAIFGVVALRDARAEFGPALRWGVGWGFILSFGLTLVTAGYMSSAGTHVGIASEGAATLPLMGWSGAVGDIRPAHFLALHAMQVLPLAGLWFDRKGIAVQRMRWVALAYVTLTGVVFAQALSGMPLIRL